jgi:hypothetical protein
MKAVSIKILGQVNYVVWRDGVVVPGSKLPGAGRGKKPQKVSEQGPSEPLLGRRSLGG